MSWLLHISVGALLATQLLIGGSRTATSVVPAPLIATINFQTSSNSSNADLIVDYGDGSSQVISSAACLLDDKTPCSIDQTITHAYKMPGTYIVTLNTSDCNEALIDTTEVTVR